MRNHPCFSKAAGRWFEAIHLPVAPKCNIKCSYCNRLTDCAHENRPGIASRVITPGQALRKVEQAVKNNPRVQVACISGPGDALANKSTFDTLALLKNEFPQLIKCISTNGLLLAEKIDELVALEVSALSVTVNAVDGESVNSLVSWLNYREKVFSGLDSAEFLIQKQLDGVAQALKKGLQIKINSLYIPGLNDEQLIDVAVTYKGLGVKQMNIVPFMPQDELIFYTAPNPREMQLVNKSVAHIMHLTPSCHNCQGALQDETNLHSGYHPAGW